MRALDGVTVELASWYTAIMGPPGSGKSTLMHCVAGLDDLTSGGVWIGGTPLGSLSDKARTLLRRREIGFVFQSYNLIPTLTAKEDITLPLALAGDEPDVGWLDDVIKTVRLGDRLSHRPSELSGGSSSASLWRGRWRAGRRSSSPTSPPGTSTPAPARRSSRSCTAPSTSWTRRS